MGRSVQVGFVLTAKDQNATSVIKGMKSSLVDLAAGTYLGKQALDAAVGAIKFLASGIEDVVGESLKFQSIGIQQQFYDFGRSIDLVEARIGDAFLPTLRALMQAFGPIIKSVEDWIVANNKMIATKILEWTVDLGKTLTSVVATAVILVAKAWYGWIELVDSLRGVFDKFVSVAITGFDKLVQGAAAVANAFNMRDTATALTRFHQTLVGLSADWDDSGDAAFQNAKKAQLGLDALQQKVDTVADVAFGAFNNTFTLGLAAVTAGTVGATRSQAELAAQTKLTAQVAADLERIGLVLNPPKSQGIGALSADLDDARTKLLAVQSQMLALKGTISSTDPNSPAWTALNDQLTTLTTSATGLDRVLIKDQSALLEHFQKLADAAGGLGGAFGTMFGKIATGAATARDAMKGMIEAVVGTLKKLAMDYLITGMTAAMAESSATSPWGWIAGIAAASALFAFGEQYIARMATGGFVQGYGVSDTVPAWLTPGEYVMTRREVDQGHPDWQKQEGGRQAPQIVVNIDQKQLVPSTAAQERDLGMAVAHSVRQMAALGLIAGISDGRGT